MSKIAVISLGCRGGGPVYAYEMTKGLIQNGHEVIAFISKDVENYGSWMKLKTKETEIVSTFSSVGNFIYNTIAFRLFLYKKLKRKYSNCTVDACYIPMGNAWDDFFVSILHYPLKIYTVHDPIRHSSDKKLFKYLSIIGVKILTFGIKKKKPDDIVVLSKIFRRYCEKKYNLPSSRVHVIPLGIFDFYKVVDNSSSYYYDMNKFNFLFFGRIDEYKGLDVLAEAFSILKEKNKNISLTIAGSGDFSPYKKQYDELEDIHVVNRWIKDEEVASYFKTNSRLVLVLPYKDATQSGVIPIAMSFKVPIIASNTGGLSEQIIDGVTGFLCAPNDPIILAKKMEEVMKINAEEIISKALEYANSLNWKTLSNIIGIIVESSNRKEKK